MALQGALSLILAGLLFSSFLPPAPGPRSPFLTFAPSAACLSQWTCCTWLLVPVGSGHAVLANLADFLPCTQRGARGRAHRTVHSTAPGSCPVACHTLCCSGEICVPSCPSGSWRTRKPLAPIPQQRLACSRSSIIVHWFEKNIWVAGPSDGTSVSKGCGPAVLTGPSRCSEVRG